MSGRRDNADEALAQALASGQTVAAAAEASGVSPRTAFRRLETASFRARVREVRSEMLASASGKLAGASGEAADTLAALLHDGGSRVRLRAAVALLSLLMKSHELMDLVARIEALERAQAERQAHDASGNGRSERWRQQ